MFITFSRTILAFSLFAAIYTPAADADTIIKVGLGNVGPDVSLVDGTFGTVADGLGNPGDQTTDIDFVGSLSVLTDVLAGASFSLENVALTGFAIFGPGIVSQATTGGTFSLYSQSGSLLLSGSLSHGVISGAPASTTGTFFNTDVANFTAGSLLPFVEPASAGFSLALTNISEGLSESCVNEELCRLNNFTADATGLIEGTAAVPEPFTAGLLLSGLVAGSAARRKRHAA